MTADRGNHHHGHDANGLPNKQRSVGGMGERTEGPNLAERLDRAAEGHNGDGAERQR